MTRYGTARSKGGTHAIRDYHKAMRQGLKEVKAAQALGEETGPRTLPDAPEKLAVRRESLGLAEIPVEQIDGTCNHLRGDAFSRGFYPILPADTEFAAKWSALCRIHLEEGIRDPVKVVEYLNHFYVMGGPQAGQRAEVFRRYYYPGHCHPPAAQAV